MDTVLWKNIPFTLTMDDVIKRLNMQDDPDMQEELAPVFARMMEVACPKAAYGQVSIGEKGEDFVALDGIRFTSHLLRANFDACTAVFPYICTAGREMDALARKEGDPLYQFWMDVISELTLGRAMPALKAQVEQEFGISPLYAMNPGSLPDWPMKEQAPLFDLLGDVAKGTGIVLQPSYLMLPIKSCSGILFTSKEHYANCAYCPRGECPNRQMPYDETKIM